MKTHLIHLHPGPFHLVKSGNKRIECRLHDEKRRTYNVGDELVFENRADGEKLKAIVTNLYKHNSFEDLFDKVDDFTGNSKTELIKSVREFYSTEDEKKWGVVGIKFILK